MATPELFRPAGVFAADRSHVWAVGYRDLPGGGSHGSAIQAWDGSAWNWVDAPLPLGAGTRILAIGGSSFSDAWVAGDFYSSAKDEQRVVAVHWDGETWARRFVPTPAASNPYDPIEVNAVSVLSPTDAWIVGESFASDRELFSIRWDGTRWSRVRVPDPGDPQAAYMLGVDAFASDDVWAVATYGGERLVLRWDGVSWSEKLRDDPNPGRDELSDIQVVSATEVWAVGSGSLQTFPPQLDPVAIWYDGTSWHQSNADDPAPSEPFMHLGAIDAVSTGEVFAVGGGWPDGTYSVTGCLP